MTLVEYLKEKEKLLKLHKDRISTLNKKYVTDNNTIEKGDIIEDHRCVIKVDKLTCYIDITGIPKCRYHGYQLTKKHIPYKNGNRETVEESSINKITPKKKE